MSGPRRMSFRSVQTGYSLTMGPMLLAGAQNVLAVAWSDTAGAGQVNSATLRASGKLPNPFTQTGVPSGDSLRLSAGPDGGYALSWTTPKAIAVDTPSGTAFVLMQSGHGTALTTETSSRKASAWGGSLGGRIDAIVAAGSNRVVVESNGPARSIGEQCGGASPSSVQSYFFRVFHGAHLERSGRLDASVMNC